MCLPFGWIIEAKPKPIKAKKVTNEDIVSVIKGYEADKKKAEEEEKKKKVVYVLEVSSG
jgi:hypothetical protein